MKSSVRVLSIGCQAGRAVLAAGVLVMISGCTSSDVSPDVASLSGATDSSSSPEGYVNQETADYAGCLESLGLTVEPQKEETALNLIGYAKIEGAVTAPEGDQAMDDPNAPIVVDGRDMDSEIRSCYDQSSGAKDWIIDQLDFDVSLLEDDPLPDGEIRAGREWAQCARDAGVGSIKDPDALGYVFIPPELTLAQAEVLGKECSAPMAEGEYWPQLDVHAGVVGPDGLRNRTPFSKLLNGPFIESDKLAGAESTDGE